jgi:small-conductance mechanosensitive channel
MTEWIVDNIQWLFPSLGTLVTGTLAYKSEKKNKDLQNQLKEKDVAKAELDIDEKANLAVAAALDRMLVAHKKEIEELTYNYDIKLKLITESLETAEKLKEQANNMTRTYEQLIEKLKTYNAYLKGVLDQNNIKYKEEHEII